MCTWLRGIVLLSGILRFGKDNGLSAFASEFSRLVALVLCCVVCVFLFFARSRHVLRCSSIATMVMRKLS